MLHPRIGYNINVTYQKSDDTFYTHQNGDYHNQNGYKYLFLKLNYYKTFNYNHTIRFYNHYKKSNDIIPLYLQINYGGIDWAAGYNEFTLSANNLHLVGAEYQYHFKNHVTYRFILNKIIKIDTIDQLFISFPTNYGFGIKIRSLLGPIDFTWGRGHIEPFNKNSKEINIFYFNFGVEL